MTFMFLLLGVFQMPVFLFIPSLAYSEGMSDVRLIILTFNSPNDFSHRTEFIHGQYNSLHLLCVVYDDGES